MTEKSELRRELEAFEEFLARHGTDRTRWPAPDRLSFASLVATSPDARRMLREAEMLDRLLDLAPAGASGTSALADRILAAAFEDETSVAAQTQPAVDRSVLAQRPKAAPPPASLPSRWQIEWRAMGVLAASLVIGTLSGLSGEFDATVTSVLSSSSTASSTEAIDPGALALGTEVTTPFEEDTL